MSRRKKKWKEQKVANSDLSNRVKERYSEFYPDLDIKTKNIDDITQRLSERIWICGTINLTKSNEAGSLKPSGGVRE